MTQQQKINVVPRGGGAGRTASGQMLTFRIMRYNPADPASVPHLQTYELEQTAGMTLFIALNEIREKLDPSLQFDFVCRAGICGSCGMMINGRPGLACRTVTKDLEADISLAPLPVFELIGDLSVNTGKWMRGMSERLETWVHLQEGKRDLGRIEEPMDPALAETHLFAEGAGCVDCGGTGFKGRMAICELLDLTDHVRELILERRPISEIKRAAKEQGMRFLRESAVDRVMLGLTTLREINKVTFVE